MKRDGMLYSADSRAVVDHLSDQLRKILKRRALELAKSDHRRLITDDDVWNAFDQVQISELELEETEKGGDGN